VGNEEKHDAPDETEGLPSEFAALHAILLDQRERVSKNKHGIFKPHSMLPLVSYGLGFVSLEPDHRAIV
jgi:hypothetical protein